MKQLTAFNLSTSSNQNSQTAVSKQRMKRMFLLIIFAGLASGTFAQRFAVTSGDWNSAIWASTANGTAGSAATPTASDAVTVNGNVTVNVNISNATCSTLSLNPTNNNQTGTLSFDASGVLSVVGNVVIGGSGNRRGAISMANGGTLQIGGTTTFSNLQTFTAGTGTIEYNGAGAQSVTNGFPSYNNLTLAGSNIKTAGSSIIVGGALNIAAGATFATASTFTLRVTGATVVDGTFTVAGTGTKTFVGDVVITSSGTWNETAVSTVIFGGNFQNDGSFTSFTGTHNFSGTAKAISGNNGITFAAVTISGTITNDDGYLTISTTLAGTGTLTNGPTGRIIFGGTSITPTLIATAVGNYVNYSALGSQTVKATAYSNLILSGSGSKTINSAAVSVTGNLSITGALANIFNGLNISVGSLTLGGVNKTSGSWGSTASPATNKDNSFFAITTGILSVSTGSLEPVADFRTNGNADFSSATNWQFDQGGNNWTDATQVPTNSNNILVRSTDTLAINTSFFVDNGKSIFIQTGGEIVIKSGFTLTINTTGTVDFNSQSVVIESTPSGTGAIGIIEGSLLNATNVTVERFIGTNKRAWRLLTIPVTGTNIRDAWAGAPANGNAPSGESAGVGTLITGNGSQYPDGTTATAAGFDWFNGLTSFTTSSIRTYNATTNGWTSANTPDVLQPSAEQGYMLYVRGDRTVADATSSGTTTLRPVGTLNQGQVGVPVTSQFAVVGNPYAAPVDFDLIYNNTGNSSVINRNFWVWDATQGTSGAYTAISYDISGVYLTSLFDDGTPYLTINSGQAFFVERNGGGTLTIEEANKSGDSPPALFRPLVPTGNGPTVLSIKLKEAIGTTIGRPVDGTLARFNDSYKTASNEAFDVQKLNNFNENISLVRDGRYLGIESRPVSSTVDTLFVPFWNLKVRDYALSIVSSNFLKAGQTAILIDNFTHTQKVVSLANDTTNYFFSITADAASSSLNRFLIVLTPTSPLAVNFIKTAATVNNGKIFVAWSTANEQDLKDYTVEKSIDGIHFNATTSVTAKNSVTEVNYEWIDESPVAGSNFYRIKSNGRNGATIYSNIVSVNFAGSEKIRIRPTIVENGRFTLYLNSLSKQNFNLTMVDAVGKQLLTRKINNFGGTNSLYEIDLSNMRLAAGLYKVTVTSITGSSQNFNVVIHSLK